MSKTYVKDIVVIVIATLLVPIALVQRVQSYMIYYYVRWYCSLILAGLIVIVFLIRYRSTQIKIGMRYRYALLLVFIVSSLYSSFLNRSYSNLHVGIFNVLMLFEVFVSIAYISSINRIKLFKKLITVYAVLLCTANDLLMFGAPSTFFGNGNFLLYSKFYIAYLHIIALGLLYEKLNRIQIYLLSAVIFAIFQYIHSGTGTIGLIVFVIFISFPSRVRALFTQRKYAFATLIISSLFVYLRNIILSSPLIQFIVVSVLHKSLDLTSRVYIYNSIGKILFVKPYFGFGQENNYLACQTYLKISKYEYAPDVQNGLLDWVVSYGFIGAIMLIIFVISCFNKEHVDSYLVPILMSYFIMGSVEIPFDIMFFFVLALFVYSIKEKDYLSYE